MTVRLALGIGVVMAACIARDARADCVVRVEGATPAWRAAAHAVEASTQASPNDCAVIDVRADSRGAFVALQTTDGREAIRRIGTPSELDPLVRALLTSVPAAPPPAPDPATPAVAVAAPDADRAPPPARPTTTEVYAGLGAGFRLQPADDAAPVGRAHVGVSLGPWQLGAFGRLEAEHHLEASGQPRHSSLSAIGGGASFGRKQPFGPTAIVFGASFGVFAVDEESGGKKSGTARAEGTTIDPRAGLYAGIVMPAVASFRSRVQLETELALLDHDAPAAYPNVPGWGMALTLGVDFGASR